MSEVTLYRHYRQESPLLLPNAVERAAESPGGTLQDVYLQVPLHLQGLRV